MEDLKQTILDKMFYLDLKDVWTDEDRKKYDELSKKLEEIEKNS
jgi:hypothetical protein